jgi:hypothetical protein
VGGKHIPVGIPEAVHKLAEEFDRPVEKADTPVVVDRQVGVVADRLVEADIPAEVDRQEEVPLSPQPQFRKLHKNEHFRPNYGRKRCKSVEPFFTSLADFIPVPHYGIS